MICTYYIWSDSVLLLYYAGSSLHEDWMIKNIFKDAMGTAKNVFYDIFLKNIKNELLNFQVLIQVLKNSLGPVGWNMVFANH